MKKILCAILATLMFAFCFSACGAGADISTQNSTTSEKKDAVLSFVHSEITLSVGESKKPEIEVSKNNVFIFWSIRDEELATISMDGVITAIAEGQTICYAEFSGEKVMCLVKIVAQQAVPMLSLSVPYADGQITLYAGDSIAVKASVKLGDTVIDDAQLEYAVDKTDIATLEDGKVIGVAEGTATVTIRANYEGQEALMNVTVNVVAK